MKLLASVYYAEGNPIALRQVMRAAERIALYEGIIFTIILLIGADYVPYIFGIDEPDLIRMCAYNLVNVGIFCLAISLLMTEI